MNPQDKTSIYVPPIEQWNHDMCMSWFYALPPIYQNFEALSGEAERGALYALGLISKNIVVEIGAYKGSSTTIIGLGCCETNKIIVSCDPWINTADFTFLYSFEDFKKTIIDAGLTNTVIPLRGCSHNLVEFWLGNIGLLFIDGDHTFEAVIQDIADWVPFVVSGGIVAFHDYNYPITHYDIPHYSPAIAINAAIESGVLEKIVVIDSLCICRKK